MSLFNYFCHAHSAGLKPTLLEFSHPDTGQPLSICAVKPSTTLIVRENKLFIDDKIVGDALDIFTHLEALKLKNSNFFPAFLGYFSYEFARYFNGPVKNSPASFPDAFFRLYSEGVVALNGQVVEGSLPVYPQPHLPLPTPQQIEPKVRKDDFFYKCQAIKAKIRAGDVYQVNLSLPFEFKAKDDEMLGLYRAMRTTNKSPFMGILHHDDHWILSGSPERLFHRQGERISMRPIAGTKKRHLDPEVENQLVTELMTCSKENAEHAMLVDLLRNDLNKIAHPNSVNVREDRSVEFYSHVMHLVSQVEATTSASLRDIFAAIFPGGTITGAPKINVMQTIADLEESPRGPYTGALGYVSSGYGCDFNILIRSVYKNKNTAHINAGCGIVIDSKDDNEWHEIIKKSGSLNDILKQSQKKNLLRRGPLRGPSMHAQKSILSKSAHPKNVLFLENQDSFSFNIIDSLRSLDATVSVYNSLSQITGAENFTHMLIGPGPGSPTNMPELSVAIELAISKNWPLLGICLGHQAIGHYFGAQIVRLPLPIHGKVHTITHTGLGLFTEMPSPLSFTRYHSLAVKMAPKDFVVDAASADDCIMAIRHKTMPIFGLQFHPESYLSTQGHELLKRFLDG